MYRHLAAVRNVCVITWTTTYMYHREFIQPNNREFNGVSTPTNSCAKTPKENPKI